MRVGILIFDEVEVLDALGPFEVFSVASRFATAKHDAFEVSLIARSHDIVRARGGLKLTPDLSFAEAGPGQFDLILVPGGVTTQAEADDATINWIASHSHTNHIASVCTGAFLLAKAGILTSQTVTTHWDDVALLEAAYPNLTVVDDARWVAQGNIFTSAGISAGLDLSLHLVEVLTDRQRALNTARQMDYAWQVTSAPHDQLQSRTPAPSAPSAN
jgi:transcriptional regulator GlxA family with amidase domain